MAEVTYYPDCQYSATGLAQSADIRRMVTEIWAVKHDASVGTSVGTGICEIATSASFDDTWWNITRFTLPFVTTGLPTQITSAKIRVWISNFSNDFAAVAQANIYGATPADAGNHVVEDYDQFGTVAFSTALSQTDFTSEGYYDFELNASGLAAIVEGVSKFSLRLVWDASNNPPIWTPDNTQKTSSVNIAYSITPTEKRPQLVVNLPTPGYIWVESTGLHYIGANGNERIITGTDTTANGTPGYLWVEETYLHYIDQNGDERSQEGTAEGATGVTGGQLWIEATKLRYIDASGNERYIEGT